jgi:hypothetical protein
MSFIFENGINAAGFSDSTIDKTVDGNIFP